MFYSYTAEEKQIFYSVKRYFERLPPLASDDYSNAFFDVVAQYAGGGQEYMMMGDSYDELIISKIQTAVEGLNEEERNSLKRYYESNDFLSGYLDEEGTGYAYSEEEFANEMLGRFKAWIDDNFSLEDMLEEAEDDPDEEEEEEEEDEDAKEVMEFNSDGKFKEKINFLDSVFHSLIEKDFKPLEQRHLHLALIYLAYHPIAPAADFVLCVTFSDGDYRYEIDYGCDLIKLQMFNIIDGTVWFEYDFELERSGYTREAGDFSVFFSYADTFLGYAKASEFGINFEYV